MSNTLAPLSLNNSSSSSESIDSIIPVLDLIQMNDSLAKVYIS